MGNIDNGVGHINKSVCGNFGDTEGNINDELVSGNFDIV